MALFPMGFHKAIDRVNLLQLAVNAYSRSLIEAFHLSYPLLKTFEVPLQQAHIGELKTRDVERMLLRLQF